MFGGAFPSDDAIANVVRDIDRRGYGVFEGAVSPDMLAQMRRTVSGAVAAAGHQYVAMTGAAEMQGTIFGEIGDDPAFQSLVQRIYSEGTGERPPAGAFYQVLRCLCGTSVRKHSLNFHYDSYVVTALIPIEIPTTGQTGDLILLPNTRKIRKTYAANVVDKLFLDNRLAQWALAWLVKRNLIRYVRCRPIPGNLYFFWGYRTIHTNEPCDPDKVRATVLYHYANPHAASAVMKAVKRSPQPQVPAAVP